jgi:hypothetical protein
MGQITSSLEADSDLTIVTVVGEVNAEQVANQIISFLTREPTKLVLWDFTEGSLASLSSKDLQMIIQRGAQFADRRKGGRTAIACSREVDYGLSRMFQTFASLQHIPFEINVFRNLEEAVEWLNQSRKGYAPDAI